MHQRVLDETQIVFKRAARTPIDDIPLDAANANAAAGIAKRIGVSVADERSTIEA